MIDKNIDDFIKNQKKLNTPNEFITDAATKAKYITCATHPCQFSHPYANQDKKNKVTPIVFFGSYKADGYVRSGNVKVGRNIDMYGSASYAGVMNFLTQLMCNNKTVLQNIIDNTEIAKELLKSSGQPVETIRNEFLSVIKPQNGPQITSSKIKQPYFHLPNGRYNLLSVLTPSPIVYELKNRITNINSDAQEKRSVKNKELKEPFREIYNIVKLKYGGSNPQNISQLNTENGGISKILYSAPPPIDELKVRLPKQDFFTECLNINSFKDIFESLHKLMSQKQDSKIPLEKLRKWRDRVFEEIVKTIVEKLFAVRQEIKDMPIKLKAEQKIWLSNDDILRHSNKSGWEKIIAKDISKWILNSYSRLYKNRKVILSNAEFKAIEDTIDLLRELWI